MLSGQHPVTSHANAGSNSNPSEAAESLAESLAVASRIAEPHVPLDTSQARQPLQYQTTPNSCDSVEQLTRLAVNTTRTRPEETLNLRNPNKRRRGASDNVGDLTPRKACRGLGNGIRKDNRGKGSRRDASAMKRLLEAGAPSVQQLSMNNIPAPGNRPPIVIKRVAGLVTQLRSLKAALNEHKNKVVCLSIKWGTGSRRGRKHKNCLLGYIPSILQLACRGHRAVILDLLMMIPNRRDLDPRQITVCDSSSSAAPVDSGTVSLISDLT